MFVPLVVSIPCLSNWAGPLIEQLSDTCMTSLFACTWMCRQCGREACKDCYSKIEQLTIAAPDAGPAEVVGLQAKKERHAHQNPFFLACNRRSEHTAAEFNRVSRFSDEELSAAVEAMEAYLATPEEPFTPPPIATRQPPTNDQIINSSDIPSRDTSQVHAGETTGIDPTPLISAPPSGAPSPLPTHSVRRFTNDEFNDTVFHDNWINGEPLVVTGTLSNFRIQWTPEYLSATYGNQEVVVLDCQGEGNKRLTVSEFFTEFGKYKDRKEIWKLKVSICLVECLFWQLMLHEGLASYTRFQVCIPGFVQRLCWRNPST